MNNQKFLDMMKPFIVNELADTLLIKSKYEYSFGAKIVCRYCRGLSDLESGCCSRCGAPLGAFPND